MEPLFQIVLGIFAGLFISMIAWVVGTSIKDEREAAWEFRDKTRSELYHHDEQLRRLTCKIQELEDIITAREET